MLNKEEPRFVPRQKQISISEALRQKQNADVLYKLIYTTLAMIFIPLTTYFVVNKGVGGKDSDGLTQFLPKKAFFELESNQASMYGGFAAVFAVLCIMVAFVVMAINESDESDVDKKTS